MRVTVTDKIGLGCAAVAIVAGLILMLTALFGDGS